MVDAISSPSVDGTDNERPILFLSVAHTPTAWHVAVAHGGRAHPLAEKVEETLGRAMSRAEILAWDLDRPDLGIDDAETSKRNAVSLHAHHLTTDAALRSGDSHQ